MALTGGSGVVGSAVLRHLVAAGEQVRALARSSSSAGAVAARGATAVSGDILDHQALIETFSGCDLVYHVAGVNEMCSRNPERMYRVNVDGSRAVLRACAAAGVKRLVYTSSAVTIGEPAGVIATEKTTHRGSYLSAYERSKHHAERAVLSETTPVEVVTVNPSSVQGPGRSSGTGEIILRVLSGRLPVLVESTVSIVDIDDCARGHLLAGQNGSPGERYLLSGFTTSVSAAVSLAAEALGREVDVKLLPTWLAGLGAAAVEAGARLRRQRPRLCREMIRVVAHGHSYDGSRATRELGLEYTAPDETLRRLVEWFVAEDLL
ncbi:MAG: NAD-dependent epimerase/dehydratase family protein [Acidimicrobiia bacterium]